ncbi:MAG: hypothetical protein RQ767_05645, partial [Thermovirgaceae bacterium]|nr:hypothetical protein [Thermovirgaceae bacterium]
SLFWTALIIKLIEQAKFIEAIKLILLMPDDAEAKVLWKLLAEASSAKEQFQIAEYAWTRAAGIRIRMTLVPKP